ncbi:hypothetical protein BLA60_01625 [Actinophytocola xinjiangensis]|uniref:Acyl-CoA synthetase (AMP-forming)/AMP-acid ligase II n=1 Tax=Actinophytocola xinjiangensis TaxID=485602 RepID=A0A7Z0WRD3_9PSEU|nr:AMP-binding protein [Actinophytocola xinjiangensis]OLF13910.1 hypothetical protein BLA60_01625 [Actinophytocola xinjiangensis]
MTRAPLADLLADAAEDSPTTAALRCGADRLTYAELATTVRRGAAAWLALGLAPGERVAAWAVNTLDCAVAMLSVVVAGGALVPLNPRYTPAEASAILARAGCRFLLVPDAFRDRPLATEAAAFVAPQRLVRLGGPAGPGLRWSDLLGPAEHGGTPVEHAVVQFTSGTTGTPKGAVLRQAPLVATAATWAATVGLRRADVFPVTYPLAHVGGFKTGLLSPFHARATAVLLPHVSRASVVELVGGGEVAVFNAPPTVQGYVLDALRAGELPADPGVRTAVIGSAVVPPDLVRALRAELGVRDVVIGYGLTEATGVCTMTRPGDPPDLPETSIGAPIEGVEVRIAGRDERGPDQVGELEVRGANVMAGYLDDPAATAEVVHDGWLRTGDLAWLGVDGNVRIVGRARELIIVGGFNVYPAEVEHALREHPAVREAAVVGVPHERLGEAPAAFVVADGEPDLLGWARGRLADFKVPRHLWFVDALPRGAVGKVAKPELTRLARTRLTDA